MKSFDELKVEMDQLGDQLVVAKNRDCKEMTNGIVIIGAGGHAISINIVALSCGHSIISYVDYNKDGNQILGIPIISTKTCYHLYQSHNF